MLGMRLVISVGVCGMAWAGTVAQAEEATTEGGALSLPEVVVSAPRVEEVARGTVLTGNALALQVPATSDAAHLLGDIPGVSLYGAGGVSSLPALHGMADDRVDVLVDGMRLMPACPNHMNAPLSYISPTQVTHVDVLAGITPVSVGGDSIGGTVQVNSAAPEFAKPGQGTLTKGQVVTFYRSNGDAYGANVGATLANEAFSITYSGSTAQASDYHAANDFKPAALLGPGELAGDVVGSSRYRSENQAFGIAMRRDNHLLELKVNVQDIPYEGFPNQRMDLTGNTNTNVDLRYTGQYQWGTLQARAYHQKTDHSMQFGTDKQYWYGTPSTIPGMPMNANGTTTGAVISGDIFLSERDELRIGTEIQNYRLDDWWPPSGGGMAPNTFENINHGKRDRFDVFSEWEAHWSLQWLSLVGVRTDRVATDTGEVQGYATSTTGLTGMMKMMAMSEMADAAAFNGASHARTDQNWDLTALSRYTPSAIQSYEFGYAQKTRAPNLYERYAWSNTSMMMIMNNFVGDGNGYVGNINLKPEVAHTVSATADWHDAAKEQWGLKVTPYYTYVQDYIDAQRCPVGTSCYSAANSSTTNQFVDLQYVNQNAQLYGIDVSGHLSLGRTAGYGSFGVTGLMNYTKGTNETTHDNLYDIMPLNAKVALVQQWSGWTNTAEVQMVAGTKEVSQVRNEIATGGYTLLNCRTSHTWGKVRLDVGVENLLDRSYSLPLGGAYVGQGVTMGINSIPWGVAVPGMGRSVYTALNVTF